MNNVVQFKKPSRPKKSRSRLKKRATPKAVSDASLIRGCVAFAQSIGAFNAGYKADPDGDSRYATQAGISYSQRANEALEKISNTPAVTAEGLRAKARIVPMIIEDIAHSNMDEHQEAFFLSFAADAEKFLRPITEQNWREERLANAATPAK